MHGPLWCRSRSCDKPVLLVGECLARSLNWEMLWNHKLLNASMTWGFILLKYFWFGVFRWEIPGKIYISVHNKNKPWNWKYWPHAFPIKDGLSALEFGGRGRQVRETASSSSTALRCGPQRGAELRGQLPRCWDRRKLVLLALFILALPGGWESGPHLTSLLLLPSHAAPAASSEGWDRTHNPVPSVFSDCSS